MRYIVRDNSAVSPWLILALVWLAAEFLFLLVVGWL